MHPSRRRASGEAIQNVSRSGLVRGAEFDFVKPGEHVKERDGQAVHAAHHGGVPKSHESIQPQRRGRPVVVPFVATVTNSVTDGTVQFSGKRASTDPRGIRLHHPDHASEGFAGSPVPGEIPRAEALELVTYGYVP